MKTQLCFLLLAGAGAAAPAWAETYTCDDCSKAQRDQMAIQKLRNYTSSARGSRPYLYLADVAQGKAYKYEYHVTVTTVPGAGDGDTTETRFWATELPVESDVANGIAKLRLALKSGRDLYDTTGSDMPSGVYDAIERPSYGQAIDGRIKNSSPGIAQSFIDLGAILRSGFTSRGVVLSVRWHYPDGSVSVFVFDQTTQEWKRDPSMDRDRDGNTVPILRPDFSGGEGGSRSYDFKGAPDNFDDFMRHARDVGVTITGPTSRGSNYRAAVSCATAGGKTTCRVEILPR